MDIVNTLTLRHIKTHKKRSVLTVLAIIVSVAMVTAVFTSAISFVKYFQQATVAVDGSWHARFEDSDYLKHRSVYENDKNIKSYAVRTYLGSTQLGDIDNAESQCNVFSADDEWFKMRNVVVSNGRYPQNSNEILICEKTVSSSNLKLPLGGKITLKLFDESGESFTKEFLIVGYTKSDVSATENTPVFTGIDNSSFENIDSSLVFVEYKTLDNSIWDKVEATKKAVECSTFSYHSDLFMYSGIARNNSVLISLGGFAGILLLIIAIVSVFMIYDSFAVSYQERAKYLGMLASVGATKRQKRRSIYFEGFILGLIGIPLGVVSGVGGIAVTFKCIEDVFMATVSRDLGVGLNVYVNWLVIIGTVIVSAVTIFVSSYIPAKKASKTTAIEAIRQTNTVKVKKAKKLRTSALTQKIFGYEGTIAAKNFKRNGRRSRSIVFALFLSVVVFLTSANFSMMFSDVMSASYTKSADSTIYVNFKHFTDLKKAVREHSDVDRAFIMSGEFSRLDSSYFKDSESQKDDEDSNNCVIIFLDNESFDGYLKEIGEKTEKYHDKSNPAAVLQNISYQVKDGSKITVEPIIDVEGKTISAGLGVGTDESGKTAYKDVSFTVASQTSQLWSEESFYYQYSQYPVFIMSEDFNESFLTNDVSEYHMASASIFCQNAEQTQNDIVKKIQNESDSQVVYGVESGVQADMMNNLLTIAKVFIYGFITLITIIAIMNIINTISNSMNERRREFAMIRSVGMTPASFKKMIYLEAIRYGGQSLLFSVPVSVAIHWLLYKSLAGSFDFGFKLHIAPYAAAVAAVFAIIGLALLYSASKIKDDNIIETLKADIN